ncbi:MAG: hypothetical protein GEU71_09365 [Actinobacteria bacterium]|nr:hypothetical protein [Actinomycetota bacterium]
MDEEQQAAITKQLQEQLTQEELTLAMDAFNRGDFEWIPNEFGVLMLVLAGGKIRVNIIFPRPPDPTVN